MCLLTVCSASSPHPSNSRKYSPRMPSGNHDRTKMSSLSRLLRTLLELLPLKLQFPAPTMKSTFKRELELSHLFRKDIMNGSRPDRSCHPLSPTSNNVGPIESNTSSADWVEPFRCAS